MKRSWYNFLVPSKETPNKGPNLYECENLRSESIIVSQSMKNMKFTKFDGVNDLTNFAMNTKFSHSCLFEIIRPKQLQKFYMDLDIYIKQEEEEKVVEPTVEVVETLEDQIKRIDLNMQCEKKAPNPKRDKKYFFDAETTPKIVFKIKEILKKILPLISDSDIFITSSSNSKKHSFHIILDKWCTTSNLENKALFKKVYKMMPKEYRSGLDQSMYKSNQQFRLYNSHKYESTRVKLFDDKFSTWKPPITPLNDKHLEILRFMGSLIVNTSNCSFLPSFIPKEEINKFENSSSVNINREDAKLTMAMFRKNFAGSNAFGYISFEGCFLQLKRYRPSMCPTCERVHQNENPYILVVGKERNIYFDCRRADIDSPKFYIGSLGEDLTKTDEIENDHINLEEVPVPGISYLEDKKLSVESILNGFTVKCVEKVKPKKPKRVRLKLKPNKINKVKCDEKPKNNIPTIIKEDKPKIVTKIKIKKSLSLYEELAISEEKEKEKSKNSDVYIEDISGLEKIRKMQNMSDIILQNKKRKSKPQYTKRDIESLNFNSVFASSKYL